MILWLILIENLEIFVSLAKFIIKNFVHWLKNNLLVFVSLNQITALLTFKNTFRNYKIIWWDLVWHSQLIRDDSNNLPPPPNILKFFPRFNDFVQCPQWISKKKKKKLYYSISKILISQPVWVVFHLEYRYFILTCKKEKKRDHLNNCGNLQVFYCPFYSFEIKEKLFKNIYLKNKSAWDKNYFEKMNLVHNRLDEL